VWCKSPINQPEAYSLGARDFVYSDHFGELPG
jgi:hypothetical protein